MVKDSPPRPSSEPTRQVVLLGASNLTRGISTVIGTSQLLFGEPLRVLAALGHGRSYGKPSTVLFRGLPGILQCGLWESLRSRASLPTSALITDIGNDIMYGVEVPQILAWVDEAVDRLQQQKARISLTLLPVQSVSRLTPRRFKLLRRALFPSCNLEFFEALDRAHDLNDRLARLAAARGIATVAHRGEWYGFDPIHIRRCHWSTAWSEVLSPWQEPTAQCVFARQSLRRWLYLRTRAPQYRTLFGLARQHAQPCARLADGTTISFY